MRNLMCTRRFWLSLREPWLIAISARFRPPRFVERISLLCRRFCGAGQTVSVSKSSFGGSWLWDVRSSFALAGTAPTIQQP